MMQLRTSNASSEPASKIQKIAKLICPSVYHVTLFRVKQDKRHTDDRPFPIESVIQHFSDVAIGGGSIKSVDISTRFKFAEDQFYLPLSRINFISQQKINLEFQNNVFTTSTYWAIFIYCIVIFIYCIKLWFWKLNFIIIL